MPGRASLPARAIGLLRRARPVDAAAQLLKGGRLAVLDYPVDPSPRHPYAEQPHPELHARLAQGTAAYRETLDRFLSLRDELLEIPAHPGPHPAEPSWISPWQPGLDCVALYGFTALERPARYFEIGSGVSTKFVRRAIRTRGLATEVLSVDPHPRSEVDAICDRVVRTSLEAADLSLFDQLEPGDVLFLDGSHRVLTNSDATVFFLEVFPRLPSGVLVGIHDVWLPFDYPAEIGRRLYSEQYLLAAQLLAESGMVERVVLPAAFVSADPELRAILAPFWDDPRVAGVERHGCAFWLRS